MPNKNIETCMNKGRTAGESKQVFLPVFPPGGKTSCPPLVHEYRIVTEKLISLRDVSLKSYDLYIN
jgi:hypothetical protein